MLKNRLAKIALIASVALLTACSKVPAGNVGVKFDLYGGDKGVTGEVVGPGKYWLGWNEEMYLFPTYTQTDTYSGEQTLSFQDKEGTQLSADVGISFSVNADKADTVFQKYRKGINEISDLYLRNMVRDAINTYSSKMDASDIYGAGKEELIASVSKNLRDQVGPIGILVEKVYWVGPIKLPPNIAGAINAKAEATQKAQQRENELQTAKAQAEIEREKARGEADALVIAAKGEAERTRLLQQEIDQKYIDYVIAQRWDGKLPTTTGGVVPMLNIK